ncbi:type VI secretion system Vgr family protein [Arenibaculum pallidiluteum]|uniref:type VI secretion system Vgr family protein n=1 Tax=Arenibaculum pallidiluteum TaxID=2812559 RepID=UPI001A96A4E4|nr:type VI secretion system tip protein TssI/VgrG [Arenibaculum pallidiluteum]
MAQSHGLGGSAGARPAASASGSLLEDNRYAALTSPALNAKTVKLRWLRGEERLGEPFLFEAKIISRDPIRDLDPLIGQPACTAMKLAKGATRHFHGIITRCRYIGIDDTQRTNYLLEIRPWLWLLGQRQNSRVFQNKSTMDIVRTVFADHPQASFIDRTKPSGLPPLSYCVQYQESDLAFVSRLLEHEGIYYYFAHFADRHQMVLVNDPSAHGPCDPIDVATHLNLENPGISDDIIWEWQEEASLQPSQVMLDDYDFEKPNADLKRVGPVQDAASGKREIYRYPGQYAVPAAGQILARLRAEEIACRQKRVQVSGNMRQLKPGYVFRGANPFDVTDRQLGDKDRKRYLVLGATFDIRGEAGTRDDGGERQFLYRARVEGLLATTPFRPPLRTTAPVIAGPQTAVVVGPSGEDVLTDAFGRVKVQFHWDRYGTRDENSSCWMRVAQSWAGPGFGAIVTPRIGQEVVVAFEGGDPDCPLVVGTVYNQTNMPAEALPRQATRSGFRTRSSPGGNAASCNELRFEDRRGSEHVYLRAERNHVVDVSNLFALAAGGSATLSSRTRSVLESAARPGAPIGSRIEVTPQGISLRVSGPAGEQCILLGPEGITLSGTMITLMSRGMLFTLPIPIPLPPTAQKAFEVAQQLERTARNAETAQEQREIESDRT